MRRMRSSRISQEASRVFSRGGGSSSNSNHSTAGAAGGDDDGDMSEQQQQQQVPELRRSARSSALARFAYTGGVSSGGGSAGVGTSSPGVKTERNSTATATTPKKTPKRSAATSSRASTMTTSAAPTAATTPDIEDVIPDLEQAASAASSRKRRRTTATAMAAVVKTEVDVTGAQAIGDMARTPGQRGRATRGVVKKEEEEEEDGLAATDPALKVEETDDDLDNDEAFAPSASDTETKPVLPIRRKRERERKPTRIASTATTTSSSSSSTITTTILPPARWEETYDLLHKFRTTPGSAASNAAVDTMGCERLALSTSSARDQRFHTLIALMLSSQTKDTTNAAAMHRLHTELPAAAATPPEDSKPGLNLENILAVDPDKLNELIWAVGFHNNKTKYIKAAALICRDTWDSDIPDTFEGLVSLPGVGPKMAHLTLSAAWGRTEGIGVDVHVHRISNMWGWTGRKGTKTPEETRKYLEGWLPRDKWRDINWLMVGLGQTVCGPVSKKCGDCEIGLAGLCRAADRGKVNAGRRLRKLKEEEDEGVGEGVAEVKDEVKTDEAEAGQGVVGLKDEGNGDGNVAVKNEADAGTDSVMSAAKMEDDGIEGHNVKTEGVSSSAEVTPARVKREGGGGGGGGPSSVVESGEVKVEIKMEE